MAAIKGKSDPSLTLSTIFDSNPMIEFGCGSFSTLIPGQIGEA